MDTKTTRPGAVASLGEKSAAAGKSNSGVLSVVIPVYRSAGILDRLYQRLVPVLEESAASWEILFVEDGGGDGSWEVICQLSEEDDRVRGIRMSRNYGQHNALLCGIRAASGDVVVTMDDDLQHPPEELPQLLSALTPEIDAVYGAPLHEPHGLLRGFASQVTKLVLQRAMGAEAARHISAFRVFRTRLRSAFEAYDNPYANIDVMLTWATTRFAVERVRHDPRADGESGYTLRMLVRHAFNMLTGFSSLPLKLASLAGLAFAAFGGLVLIYVVVRYLIHGSAVPGFAFLASIVSLFSGVQLLTIGVIGEYLARIHFRTMNKPAYVVQETVAPRDV
jgi:undecaprenyl-phosphate 4-deoxy-4-formamido-L-arabinose transferase